MEYYIIDSGGIYQGQHVSDEEPREFHINITDAINVFEEVKKSVINRDNSYVFLLKYIDDKCVQIIESYYN